MNPSSKYFLGLLLLLGTLEFSSYAWLRLDNARFVHEPRSFGDSSEYLSIADLPILSTEFWTASKPPVTSLVWKLVDSDPGRIFKLQMIVSIICWGIFALVFSLMFENPFLKILGPGVVLAISLSRDIFMWDAFLGSESLALSFMLIFLSFALWQLHDWKPYKIAGLVLGAFLVVFTRDTNGYLLLMSAAIALPLAWFSSHRLHAGIILFSFMLIFSLSSRLAIAGLRQYRAVMMITALRIFPSEKYTDYFRQHGMPIDDHLVALSREPQPGNKFRVNISLYFDDAQEQYRMWLLNFGRAEYLKFLWFYKSDALQNVFLETPQESFYPDVYYYTATGYRPIIKDQSLSEIIYPSRFGLIFFLLANIIASFAACYALMNQKSSWLIPILMILLTYPQAVLIWAADANDIARHSIQHNVLLRLGFWMLILLVVDSLLKTSLDLFNLMKPAKVEMI